MFEDTNIMTQCFTDSNRYVYKSREGEVMSYDAEKNKTEIIMDDTIFVSTVVISSMVIEIDVFLLHILHVHVDLISIFRAFPAGKHFDISHLLYLFWAIKMHLLSLLI